jgi:hypothetical protein
MLPIIHQTIEAKNQLTKGLATKMKRKALPIDI